MFLKIRRNNNQAVPEYVYEAHITWGWGGVEARPGSKKKKEEKHGG